MNEIIENYKSLFAEIDKVKLTQTRLLDANDFLMEEKTLLTWFCTNFNDNSSNLIKKTVAENEGFKIFLSNQNHKENLSIAKKSLLYSDHILVLSGGPIKKPIEIEKPGGNVIHGLTDWYKDLLSLKPLLLSEFGICVPRNYFTLSNDVGASWNLVSFTTTVDETASVENNNVEITSLYHDLCLGNKYNSILSFDSEQQRNAKKINELHNINELTSLVLAGMDLPFLDNIPLEAIVKIRKENYDSFINFRYTMKSIVGECLKFKVAESNIEEFTKHLKYTYIEPQLNKIEKDMRSIKRNKILSKYNGKIKTLSLIFNFLTLNITGVLGDLIQKAEKENLENSSQNGLMLLWELQNKLA